jgi:hypothetical protein
MPTIVWGLTARYLSSAICVSASEGTGPCLEGTAGGGRLNFSRRWVSGKAADALSCSGDRAVGVASAVEGPPAPVPPPRPAMFRYRGQ